MFDLARVKTEATADAKPIIAKLSPTTDTWAMVAEVGKSLPHLKPAKVIRLLIRVGYAAFVKSERARGVRK